MSNFQEIKQLKLDDKKSNISLIPAYQFLAVQRRYEGYSAQKISIEIKQKYDMDIADSTIRWWFYKGGPLAKFYREYADIMVEMEMEEVRDFIRGNLTKAAKVLAQVMAGRGVEGQAAAQVASAKEFLDRGLGKPEETIKHKGTVGIAMLDVLAALREIKNGQRDNPDNQPSAG